MTGYSPTDQELIQAVIREEPGASDLFVERFSGFIWSVLVRDERLLPQDAEDASQRVFLKLIKDDYRRLRNWRGEGNFVSYLGPIVRHLARDLRRTEARQSRIEAGIGSGNPGPWRTGGRMAEDEGGTAKPLAGAPVRDGSDPEAEAAFAEERALLDRCKVQLSPRDQEILRRRHLQDESYREIAEAMGLTVTNVGVSLARAEKRLKKLVEKNQRPGPRPVRDLPEAVV